MARLEMDLTSTAPPEKVIAALIDFTERRPEIWPGLERKDYQVYEVGDTWADVREGSGGSIWARERYDWSTPGTVTWTVQESGFCKPGDFVSAEIKPRAGGGSDIHLTWSRRPASMVGRIALVLILATRGGLVKRSLAQGLRRIEAG